MITFLVESALLTHGLPSISDEQLVAAWPKTAARLVWLQAGDIIIGSIEEYLPLRKQADKLQRFDGAGLAAAIRHKASGALTASATMQVCADMDIPMAISCGMGGIGPLPSQAIGADLLALSKLPVMLLATAPKDLFSLNATISWLKENGVRVVGTKAASADGFLDRQEQVALSGSLVGCQLQPPLLILQGLEQRVVSSGQLAQAMQFGLQTQQAGGLYHPAVNAKLDQLTKGKSSQLQLQGLIDNIKLAATL